MRSLITALLLTFLVGCRTEPTVPANANFPTRETYNIPPKMMLETIKTVVGLPIESEKDGRLVTGWRPNEGAKFGAVGLNRTWQERTRYTITVTPAWEDPTKSTVEVTEETQQRPHDAYAWGSQEPVKRPERASAMAEMIDHALKNAGKQP